VKFVVVGMVVVEKDKIVVEMEKIVDMDDTMFEDCREDSFHKHIISNLIEKVSFEPIEEAMPAKENEHSMCFV